MDNDDISYKENLGIGRRINRTVNKVLYMFFVYVIKIMFLHSFRLNIFEEIMIVIAVFKDLGKTHIILFLVVGPLRKGGG